VRWLRREALLLAIFGGFGLFVLPALVYLVGEQLLGEYRPDGGMGTFYADLYGHLAGLSGLAWMLVLGPWFAILLLRLLWLPLRQINRRRSARHKDEADEEAAPRAI
jgi:hypothetical protein